MNSEEVKLEAEVRDEVQAEVSYEQAEVSKEVSNEQESDKVGFFVGVREEGKDELVAEKEEIKGEEEEGEVEEVEGKVELPAIEEYAVELFTGFEEGSEDAELFGLIREKCHEAGLSEEQLGKIMPVVYEKIDELWGRQEAAYKESCEAELRSLKEKYGAKYGEMVGVANKTLVGMCEKFGVKAEAFMHPSVANNAGVVEFFYKLGMSVGESNLKGGEKVSGKAELESILTGGHELSAAYMDMTHPDWAKANARVNELMGIRG